MYLEKAVVKLLGFVSVQQAIQQINDSCVLWDVTVDLLELYLSIYESNLC